MIQAMKPLTCHNAMAMRHTYIQRLQPFQGTHTRVKSLKQKKEASEPKKVKRQNVPQEMKLLVLLIVMTAIISIITLTSAAMSVVTYSQLHLLPTESDDRNELDKTDNSNIIFSPNQARVWKRTVVAGCLPQHD